MYQVKKVVAIQGENRLTILLNALVLSVLIFSLSATAEVANALTGTTSRESVNSSDDKPIKKVASKKTENRKTTKHAYGYTNNYSYHIQRSLYAVYKPTTVKVVMLGDSITYRVNWNELLSRSDVVNRGVNGDIIDGYANRLSEVYRLKPEMCFIMGGINDLLHGISERIIIQNYYMLLNGLKENGITPVIQSTLYVSRGVKGWQVINKKVGELNNKLKEYAGRNGIEYIDVNRVLSKGGALYSRYTYDGLHLFGNGYAKWRELILPVLGQLDRVRVSEK